jgi:hypothetical protein
VAVLSTFESRFEESEGHASGEDIKSVGRHL